MELPTAIAKRPVKQVFAAKSHQITQLIRKKWHKKPKISIYLA
jgi:hypothetical protein